jgi:hypothetical protein
MDWDVIIVYIYKSSFYNDKVYVHCINISNISSTVWTDSFIRSIHFPFIGRFSDDVKVCFLTASEMYREEIRKEEYCASDIDLFIRKPISTIGLIREITARIKLT